jgi:redox-sensitive bicupin YhaK (pirin superfamily)
MAIRFSDLIATRAQGEGTGFSVRSLELSRLHELASPVVVFDDFRVAGRPFGPHPHAGFSAVTYVFEDSAGSARSRDSLGNDVVMAPGGIVWTQAGSGVVHEEVPADPARELRGLQLFVNLSREHKLIPPRMLQLASGAVPVWNNEAGDRVRVLTGTFDRLRSPLTPAEPLVLLDVELRSAVSFDLPEGHHALIYVRSGRTRVLADGGMCDVPVAHGVALDGSGRVTLEAREPGQLIVVAGAAIREPVVAHGSFIMNDRSQVDAAMARYHSGQMGYLAPLDEVERS